MKQFIRLVTSMILTGMVTISACKKELKQTGNGSPSDSSSYVKYTGQVGTAELVPIGSLSIARSYLAAASAGSKILFAGGSNDLQDYLSRVDIYDTITKRWTISQLSVARQGMAVTTLGSKIFFAGGANADLSILTSRVDIYDGASNSWSTAELRSARAFLATATLGSKVFFAGGGGTLFYDIDDLAALSPSNVVDIYDDNTHLWTTGSLSRARFGLSATVVGNRIFFAGGQSNPSGGSYNNYGLSTNIDIYDAVSNTWSTSQLLLPRAGQVGIPSGNTIFFVGGNTPISYLNNPLANNFEMRDLSIESSSLKPSPKADLAVKIDEKIICFAASDNVDSIPGGLGDTLSIFNIQDNTWSRSVLKDRIRHEAVITVNNEIYIAGGKINGHVSNQVWKLKL